MMSLDKHRSQISIAVPRGRDFRTALTTATGDQLFLITQSKTEFARPKDGSRYMVDRVTQVTTLRSGNNLWRQTRLGVLTSTVCCR